MSTFIFHFLDLYAPERIISAIFKSALTLVCIVGNGLVIAAVTSLKPLRTPPNVLIVSLAVSDLLVGIIVMPLSIMYMYLRRWPLGFRACSAWATFDVMLCTASILNLMMLTIDRYMIITRPMVYEKYRTIRMLLLWIFLTWLLSIMISVTPLIIGWDVEFNGKLCDINQQIGYQLYATFGAFYLPLFVMFVLYGKIYSISRHMAKEDKKMHPTYLESLYSVDTEVTMNSLTTFQMLTTKKTFQLSSTIDTQMSMLENEDTNKPVKERAIEEKQDYLSCNKTGSDVNKLDQIKKHTGNDGNGVCFYIDHNSTADMEDMNKNICYQGNEDSASKGTDNSHEACSDDETESFVPNANSASHQNALQLKSYPINMLQSRNAIPVELSSCTYSAKHKNSDICEPIRHSTKRKKSTVSGGNVMKTLGVVMGTFTVCWLPFFILAVVRSICQDNCPVPETVTIILTWLGYVNSCLNPIIYVSFNKDFRTPFKEILCCRCRTIKHALRQNMYQQRYGRKV